MPFGLFTHITFEYLQFIVCTIMVIERQRRNIKVRLLQKDASCGGCMGIIVINRLLTLIVRMNSRFIIVEENFVTYK